MVSRTFASFTIISVLLMASSGYVDATSFSAAGFRMNKKVKPLRRCVRLNGKMLLRKV